MVGMSMHDKVPDNRLQFCKAVLLKPVWVVVLVVCTVVCNSDSISGKVIKPNVSPEAWKKLEAVAMTTHWHWYVWAIGALLIMLVGAIETAYRLYKAAREKEQKAVAALENYKTRQLELTWNPDEEPYRWW